MGRETKIGLALIIILLSAFGFVVYKKLKDQKLEVAQQTEQPGDGSDIASVEGAPELTDAFASANTVRPIAHAPAIPDQNEPADPFSNGEGDTSATITADAPVRSIPNSEPRPLLDLSEESAVEPAVRRPVGISRETVGQPETEFGLAEEPETPARKPAIEITETEPADSQSSDSSNSLPVLETKRPSAQPLLVETPQAPLDTRQRELPALPSRRGPSITLSPPEISNESDSADDKLQGFEVAVPRRDTAVVTADDERLEGFREVPVDGRRAFAQTRVEKPAPVLASATSGAPVTGRAAPASAELTPILPKRGAATARPTDPFETQPTERVARKPGSPSRATADLLGSTSRLASAAVASNPAAEIYTVQPNDNFWNISRRLYGTGRYFQALARYNADRVSDPAQMKPGQQIATPTREILEQQFPNLIERSASRASMETSSDPGQLSNTEASGFFVDAAGQPFYRVGPDDTLTSISQRHLGRASRWTEIYEKNTDQLKTADSLTLGTILRLPPDASQVRIVQEPAARR